MEGYVLKVVSGDDHEKDADPSVAEKVLTDVDRLFTEICRNIIRGELRLQGDVPESLHSRVTLHGEGALAHDARRIMHETLTYLGGPARGTFMDDTFPDVIGRRSVASAVLDIHSDLEGSVLLHGPDDDVAAFSDINLVRVTEMAGVLTRAYNGGIMGIIVKDPKRRGHYAITSGNGLIPLIYVPTVPSYDREDFAAAGPVIAMGTVVRDEENRIVELRAVENCYTFPVAVFLGLYVIGVHSLHIRLINPHNRRLSGIAVVFSRTQSVPGNIGERPVRVKLYADPRQELRFKLRISDGRSRKAYVHAAVAVYGINIGQPEAPGLRIAPEILLDIDHGAVL